MFHWLSSIGMIATVAVVLVGTGCASAPSQLPAQTGDVSSGAGPTDAVRRQLEGTWDLISLSVMPARGAALAPVAAQGTLTYDKDGNLAIDARTNDSYAPEAAKSGGVLEFKGKAVIDATKGELLLTDSASTVNPKAVPPPERRRRYSFEGDQLRLSSFGRWPFGRW